MILPSKQLLACVYPIQENSETYVGIQESTGRIMHFGKEHNDARSDIDIHNVAHKCKEWVLLSYNLICYSGYDHDNMSYGCQVFSPKQGMGIKYILAETEPEAIFKACEWVLKHALSTTTLS